MVLCEKRELRELALFAGAGGGILGELLLGWRTVAAVEIEEYPRAVLLQRQLDGILPVFPVWDDIRTFDGKPWRGKVDIVTGGFPCQDISTAGKGAGLAGKKSGLWSEMARVIGEVEPRYVFVENSPVLTGRGLDRVLMDLAKMGYDAKWCVLGAVDAGAPHKRDRIWLLANASGGRCRGSKKGETEQQRGTKIISSGKNVAYTDKAGWDGRPGSGEEQTRGRQSENSGGEMAYADCERLEEFNSASESDKTQQYPGENTEGRGESWWQLEPGLGRVANGVAHRVDRLKALGNGQVPAVVKLAWETLSRF
jgi:DNA (cytosine-5)-methyltransferase 1